MRPQLDLRPGRVVLALGAAGLAGAGGTSARAEAGAGPSAANSTPHAVFPPAGAPSGASLPGAGAGPPAIAGAGRALLLDGLPAQTDRLGIVTGEALAPLAVPVGVRMAGVALSTRATERDVLVGRTISVYGDLRPDAPSRTVALQERRGSGWATIARGQTSRSGHYRLSFRPPAPGTLALRVRFAGDRLSRGVSTALGTVNVYRLAGASWYGSGGPLACGGTLTDSRLGVAHKTLPCGTLVRLHLGRRTVQVPVIDRGPYVSGREYDLTPATKRALGFGDTGEVWATR